MVIRGLIRFSLNDYPGKMSCIVFTGNCNFRCGYCHNPHLVFDPESQPPVAEKDFLDFLETRKGKLDAVVISGGEPSIQADFAEFAQKIKDMGFCVKIDTNGSLSDKVIDWIKCGCIDFLGLDYKGTAEKYNDIAFCDDPQLVSNVHKLLKYAVDNNIPFDVRTTVHKALLNERDLTKMREELNSLGVKDWTLQQFHPVEIIDDDLAEKETYTDSELIAIGKSLGPHTHVRGLKGVFID